ncbi:MAG: ParA family protein [Bryobacter sp.]|nr:ParA family protein [Bryobacter sp.]
MISIAFFNNKGAVGKTSLVYHLAWMMADLGKRTLAVDWDPQCNLTSIFLDSAQVEALWPEDNDRLTIYGALQGAFQGTGKVVKPHLELLNDNLALLPGDLLLSSIEDTLSLSWNACQAGDARAFRDTTAMYEAARLAAEDLSAEITLIDVGPNLGAINRSALLAADFVVTPLAPDLFSLQGLRNLGPKLQEWRNLWREIKEKSKVKDLHLPPGSMKPLGYVLMQHAIRDKRPVASYERWMVRIPGVYRSSVLGDSTPAPDLPSEDDYCLAMFRHYRSLMPMAMEARKPIFHLKPADGAIGAHFNAVRDCGREFNDLAEKILGLINL